jgi:hypothetical protein
VSFRLFPQLNHVVFPVAENEGLAGYVHPGHVDAALIADVAEWIDAH